MKNFCLPSGKVTLQWKDPPFLMGKSTISTGPLSIAMLNYQRVTILRSGCLGKKHKFSLARFMFSTEISYESRLATHPLICVNYSCGCYIWYDLFVSPHSDKQFLRRKPVDFGQGKTSALEQTGGNRGNSPIRHGQLGYSW